jgi:protein-S-isoprenylcysteine O-methyltransferase Ste14
MLDAVAASDGPQRAPLERTGDCGAEVTLTFWQAWVYLGVSLAAGITLIAYLRLADPALLRRRLRGPGAEKETSQQLLQLAAGIVVTGAIVVASLDRRFVWSHAPLSTTLVGFALLIACYIVIFLVFRANTFAGANISVELGQQVVSTGPYAVVRHPYYAGLLLWVLATPLALGSWWGLLLLVPMALVLASRIQYEERFLTQNLPGYVEYCQSVRYRLVPSVW